MTTADNKPAGTVHDQLNSLERDTIGEILNISMGAAATAISTMLDLKVEITTPVVTLMAAGEFECKSLEPAIGTEIEYIEGLSGSNIMVMKQRDIRAIVNVLLGEDSDLDSLEPLDEMHLSAAGEIMNQMMGASSTALTNFLEKRINISTPTQFDVSQVGQKIGRTPDECIVAVRFLLKIDSLLSSEFVTVMPIDFTKELVASALGGQLPGEPLEEPVAA
ncbi:MAG TPA: chemotaxis protein CheC, partial [Terriglobales bacterium]|nr:chemotaxis protein CheC [Terriglobales bacterium]